MIWTILFIFFIFSCSIQNSVSCYTKSYTIPCDSSSSCSNLDAIISVSSNQYWNFDLNITLIANNMDPNESHTIGLYWIKDNEQFAYLCNKYDSGATSSRVFLNGIYLLFGSSIYMNGNLICTWIAAFGTFNWPNFNGVIYNPINESSASLNLQIDSNRTLIASNTSELPFYKMAFTECEPYSVYGYDYRLIKYQQSDSISFLIYPFNGQAKIIQLTLIGQNTLTLDIVCNFTDYTVYGHISIVDHNKKIYRYLNELHENRIIYRSMCSFVLPKSFDWSKNEYSIENMPFKISMIVDNRLTYTNSEFYLARSISVLSKSHVIIVLLSLSLSFLINQQKSSL